MGGLLNIATTFSSILGGSATAFPAFKVSAQKGLF
ncbi:MAG: hypothetical protein ACJA2G_003481 [Cognaticolwellia sp.]|jgi:hypothetical protein